MNAPDIRSRQEDVYAQMMATYELVGAAYAQRGLEVPDLRLQDPTELCLVLQKMLHEIQFHPLVAQKKRFS